MSSREDLPRLPKATSRDGDLPRHPIPKSQSRDGCHEAGQLPFSNSRDGTLPRVPFSNSRDGNLPTMPCEGACRATRVATAGCRNVGIHTHVGLSMCGAVLYLCGCVCGEYRRMSGLLLGPKDVIRSAASV